MQRKLHQFQQRLQTNLFAVARLLRSSIKVQLSEAVLLCNDEVGTRKQLKSGAMRVEKYSINNSCGVYQNLLQITTLIQSIQVAKKIVL